ncbi:MAG: hypothetical protein OXH75_08135 [Acidobacteria bacterium]|nr:hypothetical protein [Acidobacteriota bacterium]
MAELIDPRPKFVIVMGCNGAGKSAWKRANYDRLPERYYDQDSIAGGIGDWNDPGARDRTRVYVDAEVENTLAARLDFGFESTFSGRPGPALLKRALFRGYRAEGYYIGTEGPEVNARRIEQRVLWNTGHYVDPDRLPGRYRYSLSNLRRHLADFDLVEVVDNTEEREGGVPEPRLQFVAERGQITERAPADELVPWAAELLARREQAIRQEAVRAEREARKRGRGGGRMD